MMPQHITQPHITRTNRQLDGPMVQNTDKAPLQSTAPRSVVFNIAQRQNWTEHTQFLPLDFTQRAVMPQ